MATKWISPTWRMPEESNQSKFENYSLDFDGSNQLIQVDNDLFGGLEKFSVSFWYNMSTVSGDRAVIGRWSLADAQILIYHQGSSGYWRILFVNSSGVSQGITTTIAATLNTWQFISFIYDGSNVSVQLNNEAIQSQAASGSVKVQTATPSFQIGADNSTRDFTGQIDQVCIFDYALSTNQRNYLYNSGTPQNPMAISGNAPIAYYPLGGGSTGDAADPATTLTVPNESVPSATVFDFGDRTQSEYIGLSQLPVFNSITTSAWIKTQKNNATIQTIISNSQPNAIPAEKGWLLDIGAAWGSGYQKGRFVFFDSTGSTYTLIDQTSTQILVDNEWHHIVALWDGTTTANAVKIFVDGLLAGQGTSTFTGPISQPPATFEPRIGIGGYSSSGGGGGNVFGGDSGEDGFISNVQTWDTALTYGSPSSIGDAATGQIAELYNNGVPYTGTQPQAANLKGWWKMNVDTSTWNGSKWNVGTSTSPYLNSIGPISTSNTFPTTINFGNDSSLNPSDTNKLTLSIWFNSTSTLGSATGYTIFGRGPVANAVNGCYTLMARGGGGDIQFWFHDGSGTSPNPILQSSNAASTYMDGKWHHIAITVDGTLAQPELKMYIDNTLENTTTSPNTGINDVTQDLYLGQKQYTYSHLGAAYSNFCMFNTVLDATGDQSINTLYNNGTPPEDISSYSNLQFWTKLNNLTTGIIDNSSNTNNGTISGEIVSKNLVVSALNGLSSGMTTANLVTSDLTRSIPYSSYSMEFDGIDDEINFSSTNDLGLNNTVSMWVNLDSGYSGALLGESSYGSTGYFLLPYATGFLIRIGTTSASASNVHTYLTAGSWHNLTVVRNAGNFLFYVDGAFIETVALSSTTTTKFDIIGNSHTAADPIEGKISNVCGFNSILTEDQILTIYNGGVPNDISSLSPTGWWSLGGDSYYASDWICPDLGSGGNNGTSSGMGGTELVGDGPGSTANGTATSMNIPANLKGDAPNSSKNAFSINMNSADRVEDVAPTP